MGVGDGQQGSRPSESTNESTQPNQPNQPKPNTTGYSKKKPKSKSQYLGGYAGKVMVVAIINLSAFLLDPVNF